MNRFSIPPDFASRIRRMEDNPLSRLDHGALAGAISRYQRWMTLAVEHRELPLAPSEEIDRVWHTHQLCPADYLRDCSAALGFVGVVDHDGGFGSTDAERAELERIFRKTCELFEARWGESMIHPHSGGAARCIRACRVACQKRGVR